MSHTLNWEGNGVYWKYSGDVTGAEILSASTEIYGDPRFDILKYKLVDFSDVTSITISEEEIKLITFQHAAAAQSNPRIKNAIIINKNDERAKLFVHYLSTNSNWEVAAFSSLEEANQWLGRKS